MPFLLRGTTEYSFDFRALKSKYLQLESNFLLKMKS